MEMERNAYGYRAHCLVITYPAQGHINPMLEFSKRLEHKGVKVTVVITNSIAKTIHKEAGSSIALETISDGYDEGGLAQAESIHAYLDRFQRIGSQTLTQLLEKLSSSGYPGDCIVYDALLPWALDVNSLTLIKLTGFLSTHFYQLEHEVVDWMAKIWPLRTIGPTIPSMFLDRRLKEDQVYGFSMFKPNTDTCMKWLNDRPKESVVYVSFEVLAHEAVGCFVTHCGWNSTLEALSFGVPMVAVPQWTDQSTNAKYIMDVWKMGLKAPVDEKGLVSREAAKHCIREIMEGERGKRLRKMR
ncbi:hypothetical protein SLA2020_389510 [Shorea laevis]